MKQIVFLKQVPVSTHISIDPVTHTLVRHGNKSQTNPDDLHALQMAVEIRNRVGGIIVAVTMGPLQAEAVLKEAFLYGADEAILLSDRMFAGSDTWSTSYVLSSAVKKIGDADLLLFGKQAIDGDTAQVGPGVAGQLNIPQMTEVQSVLDISSANIVVKKTFDYGTRIQRSSFPCVLTVSKEVNTLPAPSLQDWENAQQKVITHWGASQLKVESAFLGLNGSPTKVVKTHAISNDKSIQWIKDVSDLKEICTKFNNTYQL